MIDHILMEVCFEIQGMAESERLRCHQLMSKMRQVDFSIGERAYLGFIQGIQTHGIDPAVVTKLTITSIHKVEKAKEAKR